MTAAVFSFEDHLCRRVGYIGEGMAVHPLAFLEETGLRLEPAVPEQFGHSPDFCDAVLVPRHLFIADEFPVFHDHGPLGIKSGCGEIEKYQAFWAGIPEEHGLASIFAVVHGME